MITIVSFSLVGGLIIYFYFVPSKTRGLLASMLEDVIALLEQAWRIAIGLLQFLGKVGTLLLLGSALTIFFNEALSIFDLGLSFSSEWYLACRELFTKPYTWAAGTTIVATTVALANLKKYDLDKSDFLEKQRERFEKRIAEKIARDQAARDLALKNAKTRI